MFVGLSLADCLCPMAIYEHLVKRMKNGGRVLMAVGQGVTDEARVVFRACTPEELPGGVATLSSTSETVVLVREGVPAPLVLADAELRLGAEAVAALRGWLSSAPSGHDGAQAAGESR